MGSPCAFAVRADGSSGARTRLRALALGAAAATALGCGAVHEDPAAAGPDFQVQGEYNGSGLGAQLVARGDGKFEAVFYDGGLPGAGARPGTRVVVPGERRDGKVVFEGRYRASLDNGLLLGSTDTGREIAMFKIDRKSPTLGAAAPEGATVLFDGSGPGGFDGELTDGGFLAAGATSREAFQSFRLHLEFRTPFMPGYEGQQRGNSGVYLQNRYEIQVLDSFGLAGEADECGALYAQKAPDVNMAFPPLAWQTYDVEFRAARFDSEGRKTAPAVVSVRHNGVPIHQRVPLEFASDGGDPEGPAPGPLHLQDLWIPVVYRNIWIAKLEEDRAEGGRS